MEKDKERIAKLQVYLDALLEYKKTATTEEAIHADKSIKVFSDKITEIANEQKK